METILTLSAVDKLLGVHTTTVKDRAARVAMPQPMRYPDTGRIIGWRTSPFMKWLNGEVDV
ncbi:hypothetical protein L4C36_20725 [Photobacterium japonica]|uniref:hypothetical protein n=1 Tax=Photobacterium japonica TaxID=2910235 RepID=UPI003D113F73